MVNNFSLWLNTEWVRGVVFRVPDSDGSNDQSEGQITRIANSLSGFLEGVEIKISPTEQYYNVERNEKNEKNLRKKSKKLQSNKIL